MLLGIETAKITSIYEHFLRDCLIDSLFSMIMQR